MEWVTLPARHSANATQSSLSTSPLFLSDLIEHTTHCPLPRRRILGKKWRACSISNCCSLRFFRFGFFRSYRLSFLTVCVCIYIHTYIHTYTYKHMYMCMSSVSQSAQLRDKNALVEPRTTCRWWGQVRTRHFSRTLLLPLYVYLQPVSQPNEKRREPGDWDVTLKLCWVWNLVKLKRGHPSCAA